MINKIKNEIYLFTRSSEKYQNNTLKSFHAFLGHIREKRPFRYAYCSEKPNTIPGATILESICIERASCIPIQGKEIYSRDILSKITNPFINELIAKLGDINIVPDFSLDKEKSKISELVRVITTTNPYILLESPERYLSENSTNLVKKALEFEISYAKEFNTKKQILLFTENINEWIDISHKVVARDHNGLFHINQTTSSFRSQGIIEDSEDYLKKAA